MLAGTVIAAAVCYAVATEALLLGSPRGRWHYPYVQPLALTPFLVAFGVSVPVLALLRIRAQSAAGEWLLVVAWIALATAAQAALRALTLFSFENIFTSPGANSFYTVTLQQPLSTVLSSFVQARGGMPLHAQSNMPGKLVLMYGLEMVTVSPAVLPWIMVILSNLGALLMYRFVRQLVEDHTTALYSAVLYLFVPAKLFFFPLMNTITPVIALALACLIVEWLKTARLGWAVAIGVLLYVVVFFEPMPLVLGLLFGALTLRAVHHRDLGWSQLVLHSVAAVATFVVCAVIVEMVWGFDLVNAFRAVRAHALEFNAIQRRPYDIWVRANLVEFFVGLGACQTVLIAGALALGLGGPGALADRLTRPVPLLTLGLLATVAAIDLIGINRGEVIRLWIFLACFLQIPAAWVCTQTRRPQAIALVVITTLLLCALGTANIGFVIP